MLDARDGMAIINKCREAAMARGEVAVPVSSRAECWLLKRMLIADTPTAVGADQMMMIQTEATQAEEKIIANVLSRFGSTGVIEAISAAVRLRPPMLCYPVHDLDSEFPVGYSTGKTISNTVHPLSTSSISSNPTPSSSSQSSSSLIPRLLDCVQFKPGSTVGDVYEALKRPGVLSHTFLSGEFVRSEGRSICRDSPKLQLGRDSVLDDSNCVLRIQTNRKSVWQSSLTALS